MKKMGSSKGMDLHAGLTNKAAKAPSETPKGPSVNSDATRSATAPSHATLGGRVA